MIELCITALLVGFFGGVHCLGMCGPLVGAYTFQLSPALQVRPTRIAWFQLLYNLGRIASYVLLGMIAGAIGLLLIESGDFLHIQRWLLLIAGIWMVVLAAWLLGWSALPSRLEKWLSGRWQGWIAPWRQKLLPVERPGQAFLFGLLWGYLPCGLVYSTLLLSLSAGGIWQGGAVMLSFGLGTLPNLLLMGMSAFWLTRLKQQVYLVRISAVSIALFGFWTIWQALMGSVWQSMA